MPGRRAVRGRWLVQGQASGCGWGPEEASQVADRLRASGFGVFWARRDGDLDFEHMHFAAVVVAESSQLASSRVQAVASGALAGAGTPDVCALVITTVVELAPTLG